MEYVIIIAFIVGVASAFIGGYESGKIVGRTEEIKNTINTLDEILARWKEDKEPEDWSDDIN